ncbi:NRDE family protein [Bacillus sp. Marseille-P3661]|uniref:NRDE family protein n=1 Tax=Bacillus sp. Marseille-P3661 TaxID=1936234 RepID=UPI000C84AE14|nr:NRDE family protein [Bacillus sp. Marseille-P3661]
MCLLLFAYNVHPEFPFILAGNRDEFYNRPTEQATFWKDHPSILAGRDLEKLGTWMGVTKSGKFAALTNYRDPNETNEGKESRGKLVADYLNSSVTTEEYLSIINNNRLRYPGYNLVFGDFTSLWYYSNINNEPKELTSGLYGLSNHLLNTSWPKVDRGVEGLKACMNKTTLDMECLFSVLGNNEEAPDHMLPQTGVSFEWEKKLSPLFIKTSDYGTRTSTVILLDKTNKLKFIERTYNDQMVDDRCFSFQIED